VHSMRPSRCGYREYFDTKNIIYISSILSREKTPLYIVVSS
jgi:hypothetical protein